MGRLPGRIPWPAALIPAKLQNCYLFPEPKFFTELLIMGVYTKNRLIFWHRLRCGALSVGVGLALTMGNSIAHAEKWTSLSGERTIDAKMVGMWESDVVLLLATGRRVNVPMTSLNAASRIQAGNIAERMKRARAALTQELKQAAAIEAAPATDPLPTPPEAPPYAPPNANMTPSQAIDTISQQIRDGHLVVIYDALPPTFRKQFDELVHVTTTKLSPQAWLESLGQLHRIADLIVTRQSWILSDPKLHDPLDPSDELTAQGEMIQNFALPLAGLARAGVPADAIALEKIREMGFGPWLHERDAAIAPYLAEIMQRYSAPGALWTVLSTNADTAILEQSRPAATVDSAAPGYANSRPSEISIELKKVDGFWIPAAVADGFADWIKQQTVALEVYEDGQMSLSDWLGGTSAVALTAPIAAKRSESDMGPEASPGEFEISPASGPMSEESAFFDASMPSGGADGYSSPGAAPRMIEPSAITPELIGTILQSIGAYGSMIQPLESATDAASFHQAADQLIAPIQAVLSLLAPSA